MRASRDARRARTLWRSGGAFVLSRACRLFSQRLLLYNPSTGPQPPRVGVSRERERESERAGPSPRVMTDVHASESVRFTNEGDGVVMCQPGSATDTIVYAHFREAYEISSSKEFSDDSRLLFKITVDSNEPSKKQQAKPVVFVGVPHTASFSHALSLCNRTFCRTSTDATGENSQGAFMLEGGFGINANRPAGNIFMAYGNELQFHTKVDFSRLAFAR